MRSDIAGSAIPLSETTKFIVDNRGKTAPTASTGIALIATNCVSNENLYPSYEKLRFVSQETYDTWFRAHPQPGDILLTNKGSQNGAVCLVPDPVDFVIAQDMVALRADEKVIDPLFLFAALRSSGVQAQIKNLDVSGIIPHFKKTDFDKLLLPYPDRQTQEMIGHIYFTLSAKIEINRRMNRTLEAIARTTFKSWFIDFDPVHAKAEGRAPVGMDAETAALFPDSFQDSPLGMIPKGWGVADLTRFATLGSGKRPPVVHDIATTLDSIPVYGGAGIMGFTRDSLVPRGCIVTGRVGTLGQVHVLDVAAWPSDNTIVIKPNGAEYVHYLHRWMERTDLARLNSGSTQPLLTQRALKSLHLVDPGDDILYQFYQRLSSLNTMRANDRRQIQCLGLLRDSLLPRLLSGESWKEEQP